MNTTYFPGIGRSTSRLGFGTAGLCGELTRNESLRLLETAYDAGIRHFDTAPLYGGGASEGLLGEFLGRSHADATVTTKFGLMPPRGKRLLSLGRAALRPTFRQFPGLKRGLVRSVRPLQPRPSYTPELLQTSLRQSLIALRRDCVDLLLVHDPPDESWLSPELHRMLDDLMRSGMIGAWGVGGRRMIIDRIAGCDPTALPVVQFEWSVLSDRPLADCGAFTITFGAIGTVIDRLQTLLGEADRQREWSEQIGWDLSDEQNLSHLLIAAALKANGCGIVLFSSKKSERIATMPKAFGMTAAADKFSSLLAQHRGLSVV